MFAPAQDSRIVRFTYDAHLRGEPAPGEERAAGMLAYRLTRMGSGQWEGNVTNVNLRWRLVQLDIAILGGPADAHVVGVVITTEAQMPFDEFGSLGPHARCDRYAQFVSGGELGSQLDPEDDVNFQFDSYLN